MTGLYVAHVVLYAVFALYFLRLPNVIREVSLYCYLTLILILGGFLGSIYSIPVTDQITLSGGNLLYGAFMMTSVLFVLAEANLIILKHVVRLVIAVDLFNFLLAHLMTYTLKQPGIINPFNTPSGPFEVSAPFIILGGVLIIAELLFLLAIFEFLRRRIQSKNILAICYVLAFIFTLCMDGVLFPVIAFGPNQQVLNIIVGNLPDKILLSTSFSIPLFLFVIFYRDRFNTYIQQPPFKWSLMTQHSLKLMAEIARHKRLQQQSETFFDISSEGMVITNEHFHIEEANPAFLHMTGLTDLQQLNLWHIIEPNDQHALFSQLEKGQSLQTEAKIKCKDSIAKSAMMSISPLFEDGQLVNYVTSLVDIDELKHVQQRLAFLADHDVTTSMANRRALEQTIGQMNDQFSASLIIIDLDHFKDVNDSYGHPMGDQILIETSRRLQQLAPYKGQWFRIGGDEFAYLIKEDLDTKTILAFADRCLRLFEPVFELPNQARLHISASIGMSQFPQLSDTPMRLLQQADAALYQAKRAKRGTRALYNQTITEALKQRMEMESALREAINHHHLVVYFQPQYHVSNSKMSGAEALVRWLDPHRGMIPPDQFIGLAEETGLIEKIGELVLRQTCTLGREWLDRGLPALKLSVNISPYQLRFVNLVDITRSILAETGFPAQYLELEITESALMEREQEVVPQLEALRDMGVSIAIDDFGTGYSSLAYLKNFPLDTLKIDRSFLEGIPNNQDSMKLTQTIITLGHNLNYRIVAEGVEYVGQLDFLHQHECDVYQGYLKSPPLKITDFATLLEQELIA